MKVREVRGHCPLYKPGDELVVNGFYVEPGKAPVCIHALCALSPLLSAFAHGASARELGIGEEDDRGYLQCPDPGPPHTRGGTVVFELVRVGEVRW